MNNSLFEAAQAASYESLHAEKVEGVKQNISSASSMGELEEIFAAAFSLGSVEERQRDIAYLNAFDVAEQQYAEEKKNSLKAISAQTLLAELQLDEVVAANKTLKRRDSGRNLGNEVEQAFSSLGQQVLSSIAGDVYSEILELRKKIVTLRGQRSELDKPLREAFRTQQHNIINGDEYKELSEQYDVDANAVYRKYRTLAKELDIDSPDYSQKISNIQKEYKKENDALYENFKGRQLALFNKAEEEYKKKSVEVTTAIDEEIKEAEARKNTLELEKYNSVITKLTERSPISEKDAKLWVESHVIIKKDALARLKKIPNYSNVEDFKSDIANFYRLCGGKIASVNFVATKGKKERAFASDKKNVIAISSDMDKEVLFHELGHHLEFRNTIAQNAICNFISRRTNGERLASLNSLTGFNGYSKDERARKDAFISPYVGKHYKDGSTEGISMGAQYLSSPDALFSLFERDKEHLELVTGMFAHTDSATHAYFEAQRHDALSEKEIVLLTDAFAVALDKVITAKKMARFEKRHSRMIEKFGRTYMVYLEDGRRQGFTKIRNARAFFYLVEAGKQGLIPETVSPLTAMNYTYGKKIPPWFTEHFEFQDLIDVDGV